MAGVVLKVRFKDELHRLTLDKIITFSELEHILTEFFGPSLPAHSIKYSDDDDDMITISSDIELKEALQYAGNHSKLLRLSIFDIQQPPIHDTSHTQEHTSSHSFNTPQGAALNHVALDLAKMILSSMTQNPQTPPPEQLAAFQPMIGQILNQSVQEMLPHLIASLMPSVSTQMKTPPTLAPSSATTNPLLAGVVGQPLPQHQKVQQSEQRTPTPPPPASVSELYPSLAPLFSSLSAQGAHAGQSGGQPHPYGTAPVPIPAPSNQTAPALPSPSPPTLYSTLPSSSPPASLTSAHQHPQQKPTQPLTQPLPQVPRVYPPFSYAPIHSMQNLSSSVPALPPKYDSGMRRLDSRCTVSGPGNEEFACGDKFIRKWSWKNEGNTEWPSHCSMRFLTGESFGFPSNGVLIAQPIKPGECVEISVELAAPRHEGTHIGQFALCLPLGEPIGPTMWMQIRSSAQKPVPGGITSPPLSRGAAGSDPIPAPLLPGVESFEQSLEAMASMGLTNRAANVEALLKHNGDVSLAVGELLN